MDNVLLLYVLVMKVYLLLLNIGKISLQRF